MQYHFYDQYEFDTIASEQSFNLCCHKTGTRHSDIKTLDAFVKATAKYVPLYMSLDIELSSLETIASLKYSTAENIAEIVRNSERFLNIKVKLDQEIMIFSDGFICTDIAWADTKAGYYYRAQ